MITETQKPKSMNPPPDPLFVRYSKRETAELLNVTPYALRQLIKRQKLVMIDGRISLAEIMRYLKTHIKH